MRGRGTDTKISTSSTQQSSSSSLGERTDTLDEEDTFSCHMSISSSLESLLPGLTVNALFIIICGSLMSWFSHDFVSPTNSRYDDHVEEYEERWWSRPASLNLSAILSLFHHLYPLGWYSVNKGVIVTQFLHLISLHQRIYSSFSHHLYHHVIPSSTHTIIINIIFCHSIHGEREGEREKWTLYESTGAVSLSTYVFPDDPSSSSLINYPKGAAEFLSWSSWFSSSPPSKQNKQRRSCFIIIDWNKRRNCAADISSRNISRRKRELWVLNRRVMVMIILLFCIKILRRIEEWESSIKNNSFSSPSYAEWSMMIRWWFGRRWKSRPD